MSDSIQSWRRQKGESPQAYDAARIYFEMAANRSLEAVGQKCNKSVSLLGRWSSRWNWVERARDYDAHLAVLEQIAREKQIEENAAKWAERQEQIREEGWALYEALKAKAEQMLRFPLSRTKVKGTETTVEPADWSFNTAARMADTALKLGRLTAELSTSNISVTDVPWSELNADELHRLGNGESVANVLRDHRTRKARESETGAVGATRG